MHPLAWQKCNLFTASSFLSPQRTNDSFKEYLFENFLPHKSFYYISKQLLVQILFFLFGGAKNVIDHHHQHSYPPFHQERFAKKLIMSFLTTVCANPNLRSQHMR